LALSGIEARELSRIFGLIEGWWVFSGMKFSNDHTRVRIAATADEGDELDRRAFGFAVGDIVTLMPDQIGIQYPDDLLNPEGAIERGLDTDFFFQ
jgi:hypothetical protein